MDIIPSYDIEEIILSNYNNETRNIILSNLKNYTKLKKFKCSICNLTKLLELPNSLIKLDCSFNNLTELPVLPNSLIHLWCQGNKLIKLPKLPNKLTHLYCNNNYNLTELPELPYSLINLECYNNNLTELPDFINPFTKVWSYNNDLTYLNEDIKTINETNSKNRTIKRMKLLNRTLLLEWSARISMNPKRIERLLDNHEIDFFDGSFDTLTH